MYKTLKVFDIHEGMPEHIREHIREQIKNRFEIMCNGCYFEYEVQHQTYLDEADDGSEVYTKNDEYSEFDEWFIYSAGVEPGESIIILYW